MLDTLTLTDTTISFSIVSDLNRQILRSQSVNELLDIRLEMKRQSPHFPDLTGKLIKCIDKKLTILNERTGRRNN